MYLCPDFPIRPVGTKIRVMSTLPPSGSPASAPERFFLLDRRRLLGLALLGLATFGALVAFAGGRSALDAVVAADWRWLALAFGVHYASFAVRGHRWQRLLALQGHRVTLRETTTLLLTGWFVSALLPARAGDFLRVGVLRMPAGSRGAVPVAGGLSTIVLERALDILAILALGAAFAFSVLRDQVPGYLLTSYAAGLALIAGFLAALLVAPALLEWLTRLSSHRIWQLLMHFAQEFVLGLRTLLRSPGSGLLVTGESLFIWLCDAAVLWLVVLSLNDAAPFGAIAFIALTVDVLAAIPLTPGGVGQIDAAYTALLALLPLPPFNVGVAVLIVRFITYWSFLLFSGLVALAGGWLSTRPTE